MNWWKEHGPKITNAATVAAVGLSTVQAVVPPSWQPYVIGASVMLNAILNVAHNVQHNAADPVKPGAPA